MISADLIVTLSGGSGTQAEHELAAGLRKPQISLLGHDEKVGIYPPAALPGIVTLSQDEEQFVAILHEHLKAFHLARPTYATLRAAYHIDPADIHACTMQFPNTCAIRMSEALVGVVPAIQAKFIASGLNLCPHDYVRGAADLASVLRRADVFGNYNAGFSNPGTAPQALAGKKGIVAYLNIPNFDGQGHIDLWDGALPAGSAYWNADPIWYWALS